jgi:hypothetical protein
VLLWNFSLCFPQNAAFLFRYVGVGAIPMPGRLVCQLEYLAQRYAVVPTFVHINAVSLLQIHAKYLHLQAICLKHIACVDCPIHIDDLIIRRKAQPSLLTKHEGIKEHVKKLANLSL